MKKARGHEGAYTRRPWASVAIAAILLLSALAPYLAGLAWPLDLVAVVAPYCMVLTIVAAVVWLVRRRWRLLGVAALALALHIVVLAEPRAPSGGPRSMRVMLFNVASAKQDHELTLQLLQETDADVVVLIEPRYRLLRALRASEVILDRFPHAVLPTRSDRPGWCIVLSRWPQRPIGGTAFTHESIAIEPDLRLIDGPRGPFVLAVAHPTSPRSHGLWTAGNRLVRRLVERLDTEARPLDLPVVIAADLNATPTSWRSRHLSRAGDVRRAKPRRALAGTYPAAWPWPMQLAIDDLWLSEGLCVAHWSASDGGGSDHRPVVVDVAYD